jgi:hypothetical protein
LGRSLEIKSTVNSDSKHLSLVYYSQWSQKRRCFYSVAIESALENANGKVHHKPREIENDVTLFGKIQIPYRRTQTLK